MTYSGFPAKREPARNNRLAVQTGKPVHINAAGLILSFLFLLSGIKAIIGSDWAENDPERPAIGSVSPGLASPCPTVSRLWVRGHT